MIQTVLSRLQCKFGPNEQKKDVGGSNPVSARGEGVKNFAKSVAEGAQGIAQKVTGNHEGNPNAKDGGFSGGKYQNEEEVEKGMKTGVDKKGDEQSSI
ncbi:uncharacterized protein JCM15063_001154 [Sporobolomyces koalae]|uniref:uncharacterized protein n=1 Tax=Sporobolomyces koalae TaxID=500713 RepID=UPI00317AE3D1